MTEPKRHAPRTYLDDGVYAWYEGMYIWLETKRGTAPLDDGDQTGGAETVTLHTIALDAEMFLNLVRYCLGKWDLPEMAGEVIKIAESERENVRRRFDNPFQGGRR